MSRSWQAALLIALTTTMCLAQAPRPAPMPVLLDHGPARDHEEARPAVDHDAARRLATHAAFRLRPQPRVELVAVPTSGRIGDDARSWSGPVVGEGRELGWFALGASGPAVAMLIGLEDGRTWSVRSSEAGGPAHVRRVDGSIHGSCVTEPGGAEEMAAGVASTPPDILTASGVGGFCGDDDATIDMLVFYTADVRVAQGGEHGARALVALSEELTNLAYAASGITTRARVLATQETIYTETGNATIDLDRLVMPDDGFMDEVHLLRDAFAADVVSLIVEDLSGACGKARFSVTTGPVGHPELGFHVVAADCAADRFSFAHELGHNLGCRHNREADNGPGAFEHSHGRLHPSYGTVMAVASFAFNRVPRFSHPEILFDGLPTGVKIDDSHSAHNADSIERAALTVANFRCVDCNRNGSPDDQDVVFGFSRDCNHNGVPDECELAAGVLQDCDGDGRPDECTVAEGLAFDCNGNGRLDSCDIASGPSIDADGNGVPDECEDCNGNDVPDGVEIAAGSPDCDGDGRPDECDLAEADCNASGVLDSCEIAAGTSTDLDANDVPDECEDCNANALPDGLELTLGLATDCDANAILDVCDIAEGRLQDRDGDGLADECAAVRNETAGTHHATIQLAIEAAEDGDLVTVQPGTYLGSIDLDGRAITLRAVEGPGRTVLDGGDADAAVVVFAGGEGGDTVLDGFTVTGGGDGGIRCLGSAPTITRCLIAGNVTTTTGGGIRCVDAAPTLVGCAIVNNAAQLGGGLYAFGHGPRMINCTIAANVATVAGGLVALGNATPWLASSVLWDNGGSPILGTATMRRCIVEGGWRGPGEDNLDADPLFVDASGGDYRPDADSPCIDAGDNGPLPPWAVLDLAGQPRLVDDPAVPDTGRAIGDEPVVDIGAFERQPR